MPRRLTDDDRERAKQMWIMRYRGHMELQQIADHFGTSVNLVYRWTRMVQEQMPIEDLTTARAEILAGIREVLRKQYPNLDKPRNSEVFLQALSQYSKLVGADAPVKTEVTVNEGLDAEIAALAAELVTPVRKALPAVPSE